METSKLFQGAAYYMQGDLVVYVYSLLSYMVFIIMQRTSK